MSSWKEIKIKRERRDSDTRREFDMDIVDIAVDQRGEGAR